MKKSKLLVLGLIALMLVCGLVLASCGPLCRPCGIYPNNCKTECTHEENSCKCKGNK